MSDAPRGEPGLPESRKNELAARTITVRTAAVLMALSAIGGIVLLLGVLHFAGLAPWSFRAFIQGGTVREATQETGFVYYPRPYASPPQLTLLDFATDPKGERGKGPPRRSAEPGAAPTRRACRL